MLRNAISNAEVTALARARFPAHVQFSYAWFERSLNASPRLERSQRTRQYQRQCDIEDLCLMDWGLARSLIFVGLNETEQQVMFRYCDNPKLRDTVERERRRLFPEVV
jgi:hypothetical protein